MKIRKSMLWVTVVATLLSACSSDDSTTAGNSGDVTLWMYPVIRDDAASKQFWDKVESDFASSHPDIHLSIELQTFEQRDAQISAALAAGTGPDIVMITPDQVSAYLGVDGLLPVDDAISDDRDSFYPADLDVASRDGKLYGVPLFQNANTTSYNTKIFKDAGLEPPTTWDEIVADAPKLAAKGIAIMDYSGNPETTLNVSFYPLVWQAGGRIFSKDGNDVEFDSPAGVSALQFLVDLNAAGGLPPDAATKSNVVEGSPLTEGKVAIRYMTSLPEVAQMRAALGDENVQLGLPLTGEAQATFANPGMLSLTAINKKSNRAAAYEVIKYLTSPSVQAELDKASGTFPTRSDVPAPGSGADFETMQASLKFANPGEVNPNARKVMAILAPYIQSAIKGDTKPADALSKAAGEARSLVK